jgi:hypothetical protein
MNDHRAVIATLRWASRGLLVLAWCALAAWIVGRVISDRFFWSQFVLWMPSWIIVPGSALCLALSAGLARLGFPRYESNDTRDNSWRDARPGKRSARWRLIAWAACGVVTLGMLLGEWRLFNALTRPTSDAPTRLIVWNASEMKLMDETIKQLSDSKPDIALIANPPLHRSLAPVAQSMGTPDKPAHAVLYGRVAVLSKFPIMRWAGTELGVTGARVRRFTWEGGGLLSIDKGVALLVQLDTTAALGRTTTVWLVDLPSDPDIPRNRMMREARRTLDGMTNYLMRDANGRDVADTWPNAATNPLRTPDIIAGDTNTPRGSHSLHTLTAHADGSLVGAYEQAGFGPDLTYPRSVPLLAIDHTFLAPWLGASRYETHDMGLGTHRLQEVEVFAR